VSPVDLAALRAPDEAAAQDRAWPAVRDAFATRERVPRRSPRRGIALALAVAGLVVVALTPPGMAVAGYVRDRIVRDTPRATVPAPLATRTSGRLLLTTDAGVWVLRGDGSGRLLGRYSDATWSPNGRFVAVVRDNALYAVEPGTGTVRWPLVRQGPLRDVRWAPKDGFRIAYREGDDLRVVAGDGTGDRLLARDVGAAPAAWRPGSHVLAYDAGDGTIAVIDVDGGEATPLPVTGTIRSLLYSPDGGSLLVATDAGLIALDPATGARRGLLRVAPAAIATSPGAAAEVAALGPRGEVLLVAMDGSGGRSVTTVPGATTVAWSPDGRTLLVPDAANDRWHLVDAATGADRTLDHIGERLDPDGLGRASFPAIAGWCC
jgi:dipeptidyl aminopeptidase/acylaminoacyl peptidase